MRCSFCNKTQDQVKKLIAGPGVCICNECVDLCQEILVEEIGESHAGSVERTQEERGGPKKPASALADEARATGTAVQAVEELAKIGRAERRLVTELRREPTVEEIAEVTGIEPRKVESIKRSVQAPSGPGQ